MPRLPRNAGLARERGTDPLSNFAGLGVTRPALEETRYFPPTVVGDRRAEVTLGPAGGEQQGVWEEAGRDLPSLSRGHLEEPLAWLPLSESGHAPWRSGLSLAAPSHGKQKRWGILSALITQPQQTPSTACKTSTPA